MIRFEANLNGTTEIGDTFTNFNEFETLKNVFNKLGWKYELLQSGRGGYYLFKIRFKNNTTGKVHIYLKKVTFGGRANRQYEKRAQFSAALDRNGFIEKDKESEEEYSLILGIYKSEKFDDIVICAWNIHDWGHNIGRAFNCFVDVRYISKALKVGFSQHKTSIGQIVCCFKPEKFVFYLKNKTQLHLSLKEDTFKYEDELIATNEDEFEGNYFDEIPKYPMLFQIIIDILKDHNGITSIDTMELDAANILNLTEMARQQIHNESEGFRTELGYQLAWARFYLKKSQLIESPKRAIWSLSELGWDIEKIDEGEIIKKASQQEIQQEIDDDTLLNIDSENGIESENDIDNILIENPFDPNQVDIRTRTMSLDLILKRLRTEAINMSTSFQRKANLWNVTKQSRLIESILVKFPLPAFYFDGSNDNDWLVVDGLQRLSSLDNYVNQEAFGLQNLEFLNQFNNVKFSKLPIYLQRRIEEFEITAYIIAAGTPKVLKFNVFKRINTGGLTLTSQEIRNALNQGAPTNLIKKMADLRSFKIATVYTIPEDRMLDQEFATRFLAFYLFNLNEYNSDLDGFLNKAMDEINSISDTNKILEDFDKAMNAAIAIFENDAFRKRYNKDDKRKPINKALFEVWSVLLSKLDKKEIDELIKKKEILKEKFIELLYTNESFNKAISSGTGDKTRVKTRFNEINIIIQSIITP